MYGGCGGKIIEMWCWWWRAINRNVVAVVEGKQYNCGGVGGGGKTIQMWWRWCRENNTNVVMVVVEGKQYKCGGGGGGGKTIEFYGPKTYLICLDDHKAHGKQLKKRRHKKFKPYKYSMGEEDED